MSSRATLLAGSIVYGLLVFAGAASLGFVVLPRVGHATGFRWLAAPGQPVVARCRLAA